MSLYLGFCNREYSAQGGIADLVAHGRRLADVAEATLAECHPYFIDAKPARHVSIEEQRIMRGEIPGPDGRAMVTMTSDMRPITTALDYPATPARVEMGEDATLLEVGRFGRLRFSVAMLVDEGDHKFHFEWSDFKPLYEEDES